jgi:hypothetical protein
LLASTLPQKRIAEMFEALPQLANIFDGIEGRDKKYFLSAV